MKLPDLESATVPRRKLTDYLLSTRHPVGESKADYFARFGFFRDNWEELAEALLRLAAEHDVIESSVNAFGTRYVIEGAVVAPDGAANKVHGRIPFAIPCGSRRRERDGGETFRHITNRRSPYKPSAAQRNFSAVSK